MDVEAGPIPADGAKTAMEPRRLQILEMIWEGERSVGEIAERLPVSGPAVSQHLARLRAAGLVEVRAEGRRRYYRAAKERMGPLSGVLESLWGKAHAHRTPHPAEASSSRPAPAPPPTAPPLPTDPPITDPTAHPPKPVPAPEGVDELAPWYRQGLSARLTTLRSARKALEEGDAVAADSIRRIARSLTRLAIADRFPGVGAAARDLAGEDGDGLLRAADRLVGVVRETTMRDDPRQVRILVVEDSRVEALLNRTILSGPNREIVMAATAEEAQQVLGAQQVDLVVLDLTLPGVDGRDLLMGLAERPSTASIPVILLTSREDPLTRAESLSLGADAYYVKPVDRSVLSAAVAMMLERAAEARQLGRRDPLTGLKNRAVFLDDVRQLAAASRRSGVDLALAIVEVERLPAINDLHGSEVGDAVLRIVSGGLRRSFRESDTVARWGGGQFSVLLSQTDAEGAAAALKKLADTIGSEAVPLADGGELAAGWRAGTATIREGVEVDEAIARATRRLQLSRGLPSGTVVTSDRGVATGPSTVMLVEDDEMLADLIEHRLSREGFRVARFADGREALSALSMVDASTIVLDTMLPGADGFEILSTIRASPALAGVPVVVLTFGGPDDAARAFGLGASDALAKPFPVEELVARVSRLVAGFEVGGAR